MSVVVLNQFEFIRPDFIYPQRDLLEWFTQMDSKFLPGSESKKLRKMVERFGCGEEHISQRGSDLSDFQSFESEKNQLYRRSEDPSSYPTRRMALYEKFTTQKIESLYDRVDQAPSHLMHVTCTGYVSPSPAQKLVNKRKWNHLTAVSHLYHMGCYGALAAVRIGTDVARGLRDHRSVNIFHSELCTLHLKLGAHTPEQMVIRSLFGDGYIRYSIQAGRFGTQKGLQVIQIEEEIVGDTEDLITWRSEDTGLAMTLSNQVPQVISSRINSFVDRLIVKSQKKIGRTLSRDSAIFAVHPGGPKIIQMVKKELGLSDSQVQESFTVLKAFGNMSSATLPHVWKNILEDREVPAGQVIISLAFGPGLTIFGSLMQKIS